MLDAARENRNIYAYDGVLNDENGAGAGFISVGCAKSQFFTEIFEVGAGVCTFELLLIDETSDFWLGTVATEGTASFNALGVSTFVTITGGDGCALRKNGSIDVEPDALATTFA